MNQRLVRSAIKGDMAHPLITLHICCDQVPEIEAVKFHVKVVLERTNILVFLERQWASLLRNPQSRFHDRLGPENVDELAVKQMVERELAHQDERYETPNNWYSMFYSGILESDGVISWLTMHINEFINGEIQPE